MRLFIQRGRWHATLLAWLAVAVCAFAQPPEKPAESATPPINLLQPDTFILEDENGNWQTVLNFSYQAFVEARRTLQGIAGPNQPPLFSIQETSITGTQHDGFATIEAEFHITCESSNWVRVPLALPQAALAKAAQYEGQGKLVLAYEKEAGHVAWLRAEKPAEKPADAAKPKEAAEAESSIHRLKLELHVPVTKQGDDSSLRMQLPHAVRSTFQLDVRPAKALGRVVSGALLESTAAGPGGTTRFTGTGASGQFELAWRAANRPEARLPTALEANGEIFIIINGPNIRSEARLQIRSFGGDFDRFQVRLPPGAALVESNQTGYVIAAIEDPATSPEALKRGILVEVKLDKLAQEAPVVRLITERSVDTSDQSSLVELAGFEVMDAVRQWGFVATQVRDDWQPLWGELRNVRRVEELPVALRRDELSEAFEYFSQPFSLPARIVPRTTKLRVHPEYTLSIAQQQATLEGKLHYSIRGAKVFEFRIRIPEWQNVEVGPAEIVDRNSIVELEDHVYVVPLKRPSTEPHVLEIRATLPIPDDTAGPVQFTLPQPQAAFHEPATLVVQPDDNVEISLRDQPLVGLVPQHVAPSVTLPTKQQEPLYFHGDSDTMQFAALLKFNKQVIEVDVDNRLLVSADNARVEQQFAYRVEYEPVDRLDLLVPQSLKDGEMEVSLEGKRLTLQRVTGSDLPISTDGQITMRALLPAPARIGDISLALRYVVPRTQLQPSRSERWSLPLVMPRDGVLKANRLRVESQKLVRATVNPPVETPQWKPAASIVEIDTALYYVAQQRTPQVPLALQLEQPKSDGMTDVRKMWVQTWLTETARQDRVAFQLLSNQTQLAVALPPGVEASQTEVQLDGVLRPSLADSDGHLLIDLVPGGLLREYRLELRYQFDDRPAGALTIAAPELLKSNWMGVAYWHLVLPLREHIVSAPPEFSAQYQWKWQGFYWGQQVSIADPQLKQWAEMGVPTTANFYLFSTLQRPDQFAARTASQTSIVLAGSGLVLTALLALLYLPARLRLGLAIGLTCAMAIWGQSNPAAAVLAVQAAALGIGLFFFALAVRRLVDRPTIIASSTSGSSLTIRPRALESYPEDEGPKSEVTSTVTLEPSEP